MGNATEICLFLAGIFLGTVLNHSIYSFAYFPRAIGPWQKRPDGMAIPWWSRLPVIGWLVRIRESQHWGRIFWVRPMMIELLTPFALVALYRSILSGLTIPLSVPAIVQGGVASAPGVGLQELQVQFLAYATVLSLLVIATFIDIDERTIPDWITVPGTWLGILASACFPAWSLWEVATAPGALPARSVVAVHANSPYPWVMDWGQVGWGGIGLWIGILIWWIWCLSLGNLRWITRRGWRKAWVYAWVGFLRSHNLGMVIGMGIVGTLLVIAFYLWLPASRWEHVFSSLMGIGLGGMLVWSFRIVAGGVLKQEALGFGDVTLMAMVGAHFGWQIVLLAFFLAPLFGIAIVIAYWVITRDGSIPFGPYLAAATAYLMMDWPRVWEGVAPAFLPVNTYLVFLLGLLILLGSLLWVVRTLKLLVLGE